MPTDLQDLSRRLFKTAEQLWTNTALRPDQYAQPVLALIALRQMEARFDLVHVELSKTFTGRLKPTPQDYHGHGAVFLPDHARFSYLLGLPETENLAEALNAAMAALRRNRTARNRHQAQRARHDMRTWQVERRKRTRHLIELGGLVVKAGIVDLTGDDRTMIFGALIWAAEKLQGEDGEHARGVWIKLGRMAFDANDTEQVGVRNKPDAPQSRS